MPKQTSKKWVFGYIINEESILRRGLIKQLGTAETPEARSSTMLRTLVDSWKQSGYEGLIKWTGVIVNKEVYTCLTFATNDPRDMMLRKPSREDIDKWKKVLETDLEPQWYLYA